MAEKVPVETLRERTPWGRYRGTVPEDHPVATARGTVPRDDATATDRGTVSGNYQAPQPARPVQYRER